MAIASQHGTASCNMAQPTCRNGNQLPSRQARHLDIHVYFIVIVITYNIFMEYQFVLIAGYVIYR